MSVDDIDQTVAIYVCHTCGRKCPTVCFRIGIAVLYVIHNLANGRCTPASSHRSAVSVYHALVQKLTVTPLNRLAPRADCGAAGV